MSDIELEPNAPRPRLCHLKKWSHFNGYGFNLHAEKAKSGQYIGFVDPNSPAESAGLREGDRIIEVNYVNITNENHKQVVHRIRAGLERDGRVFEHEVALLVVDKTADEYYRQRDIVVKSSFSNVEKAVTEERDEPLNTSQNADGEIQLQTLQSSNKENTVTTTTTTIVTSSNVVNTSFSSESAANTSSSSSNTTPSSPVVAPQNIQNNNNNNNNVLATSSTSDVSSVNAATDYHSTSSKTNTPQLKSKAIPNGSSPSHSPVASQTPSQPISSRTLADGTNNSQISPNRSNSSIDPYQMSAAEFKNYLKTKGRNDPRVNQVDIRHKFQIFQDM